MELPVVQFRRHRLAYTIAAVIGFLGAFQGAYWLVTGSVASFFGWLFLVSGIIAGCGCTFTAIRNSLVLQLSKDGILYKKVLYGWNSFRSYAIREEVAESGSFMYLVLNFRDNREPLGIQLDWIDKHETIPDQLKVYAKEFQIGFEGVERKEI